MSSLCAYGRGFRLDQQQQSGAVAVVGRRYLHVWEVTLFPESIFQAAVIVPHCS